MKKIILAMLAMMLILGSMVFATNARDEFKNTADLYKQYKLGYNGTNNATLSLALDIRYEHLECKVDLTNKQIDLLEDKIPQVDLDDYKDTLEDDLEVLADFKADLNKSGFDAYLATTFRADFENATKALNDAKKSFRQYNVSNQTRQEIIDELKEYREEYAECISNKEVKMAGLMHARLEIWNEYWMKSIDKMSKKKLNTTELAELKAEIEAKNEELEDLIEEGNITKINEFLKELRKEHIHAAARFEIERLKSYNGMLKAHAKANGINKSFTDIDGHISIADENARRGHKYEDGELRETWDNIRDAKKDIKETSKDILKERNKHRMGVKAGAKIRAESHSDDSDDQDEDDDDLNINVGIGGN